MTVVGRHGCIFLLLSRMHSLTLSYLKLLSKKKLVCPLNVSEQIVGVNSHQMSSTNIMKRMGSRGN